MSQLIIVAELDLNQHDVIRAEIITRKGKEVISVGRWKRIAGVERRTGQAFEFGAHRVEGVVALLNKVMSTLRDDSGRMSR